MFCMFAHKELNLHLKEGGDDYRIKSIHNSKEKEQLTTSDIKEEEEEEAAVNPLVYLQLLIRVDKVTRYNSSLKDWRL